MFDRDHPSVPTLPGPLAAAHSGRQDRPQRGRPQGLVLTAASTVARYAAIGGGGPCRRIWRAFVLRLLTLITINGRSFTVMCAVV